MGKAIGLYRQAAEAGYDQAQTQLGFVYVTGKGVEKDMAKAKAWWVRAAKQGNASAMMNVAKSLAYEGAEAMPARVALCRAAAEKGDVYARELPGMEKFIRSQCANCLTRELPNPLVCKQCRAAAYCSKACQKMHWKKGGHKKACKERNKYLPEEEE